MRDQTRIARDVTALLCRGQAETKSSGDGSGDEDDLSAATRLQLQEAAYTALGRAWPTDPATQAEFWPRYMALLAAAMPRSTRSHQLAIVASLRTVTGRLWLLSEPSADRDQTALTETANQLGAVLALALGERG